MAAPTPEEARAARLLRWDRKSSESLWSRRRCGEAPETPTQKEAIPNPATDSSTNHQKRHKPTRRAQAGWDLIRSGVHDETSPARPGHSPPTLRMLRAYRTDSALKTLVGWQKPSPPSPPAPRATQPSPPAARSHVRSASMPELSDARARGRVRKTARSAARAIFELPAVAAPTGKKEEPPPGDQLGVVATARDRFEGKELAQFLLSRLSFTHPVSRRPLTVDECRRLDAHLAERGLETLATVADAFVSSPAASV